MIDEIRGSEPIVTDPPPIDAARASKIADRAFGESGTATKLGGERDQNFRIDTDSDDAFVLKIFNSADDRGVIDLRTQAIQHVHRADLDLPVMEPIPTTDGEPWTTVTEDGDSYFVQLYSFVPGRSPSPRELSRDALFAYGECVATMGKALRGFFHPDARYDVLWDLRYASDFHAMLDQIDDEQRRATAERVLDRFEENVDPIFDSLRAQVVHNDLGLNNVLFDDDNRVSGITDFGDLTYTALVCDLAVVLANVLPRRDDPLSAAQSIVRGYVTVTPLEEDELRLLPDLVLGRLAVRAIMHVREGANYEHNTTDVAEVWDSLIALDDIGPDVIGQLLRAAALEGDVPYQRADTSDLLSRRRETLGPAPLFYRDPVHFAAGNGVWLFDQDGRRYLDAYNNVQVLGHGNPDVAAAVAGQTRTLTTNTRYLHESVVTLSERLLETMPDELDQVLLVNSGSEANDVAWRLATAATGRDGAVVADHAYHGITESTASLSPKYWPDDDRPAHVETVAPPVQRSSHHWSDTANRSGTMIDALDALENRNMGAAAFVFDPLFTSTGIFPPNGEHLTEMTDHVRETDGLIIADEVQAGFGRTASNTWGFQAADIVPDIVTMGKPMGNGYPVAAVVTRSEILSTLRDGSGIFSTFGGNPVSSVAALTVLDVLEDEQLLGQAGEVGEYLHSGLTKLATEYELIGEIRQSGLMIGVELVRDRETWTPATDEAIEVVNRLRQRRILVGTSGKDENVLKIRPPLVFETEHADHLLDALDAVLASLDDGM